MYVLECGKYTNIVNWNIDTEHNEHHFIVHNIDEFTKQVLPVFFKFAKYESFQRKLYRWGFIKTRRSKAEKKRAPKSVVYVHPCFRMGDYSGAAVMTCSGTSVEICKSTQKHRKREQRQKESDSHPSSKKQRIATSSQNNQKVQQQQQQQQKNMPAMPIMPAMTSTCTFPAANNMFMMMNSFSTSCNVNATMMPMPTLNNNTMFNTGFKNERIEDHGNVSLHVISRPTSSLNGNHGSSIGMSEKHITPNPRQGEEDISDLLARAQYQRQINRIRLNNLSRDNMIQELQTESLMDGPRVMDESNVPSSSTQSMPSALFGNDTMISMTNQHENIMQQTSSNYSNDNFLKQFNTMNGTNFENQRELHRRVINDAFKALDDSC